MNEVWDISDKLAGRIEQSIYASDLKIIEGRILHSPVPQGRITSLKLPPLPSDITYITPHDIPGETELHMDGVSLPLFATDEISWAGQPILAAAGNNLSAVDHWLAQIELDIDVPDNVQVHEDEFHRETGNSASILNQAFQFIEESMVVPCREGEGYPSGATCLRDGDSYRLYVETMWPHWIEEKTTRALNLPADCIKVIPGNSGSSQISRNDMWQPACLAVITALLSWKAKQSVRLDMTPDGIIHGPGLIGAEFHLKGTVDAQNILIALNGDITLNTGVFLPFESELIDRIILGLFSLYPCPHYSIKGRIRRNPFAPSTFGPAGGFELGFLAGELLASRIAESYHLSSPQWKHVSIPKPNQMIGPGVLQPKEFPVPSLLAQVFAQSDYERKSSSYNLIRLNRSKLKRPPEHYSGIGLTCAWFGNGFISRELRSAGLSITLDKEGCLSISMPTQPGEALTSLWIHMAEKKLGIDGEKVKFNTNTPPGIHPYGPSIMGTHVSVYTRLLEHAFHDLSKRRFRDALPITINRMKRHNRRHSWNRKKLAGSPFETYSWGAGVVEVLLSSYTSAVESVQIWLQIEGGQLLNMNCAHAAVENSAELALQWCSDGSHHVIQPQIDIQFAQDTAKSTPKDVSTLPWLLVPAAFIQAVRQASGSNIDRLPVTPQRIWMGGIDT